MPVFKKINELIYLYCLLAVEFTSHASKQRAVTGIDAPKKFMAELKLGANFVLVENGASQK